MSNEDDRNKELVKLGERLHIDRVKVENGTLNDGQCLLGNGQWRTNQVGQDIKDSIERVMLPGAVAEVSPQPQQPSQGAAVCWERFLHLRTVRVLLVENDDSTRHVVAALLRNCSYEVVETSNGLQAWKILEDLTNRIDVVLTEVVMPCLSGIALLCKIMSHKTRKNVPVIMMSSHDSMGLVFKCLSKGAVDFLLKPIRKNELKNLWQHVWRRCHSSSGSGSESGTQTQKSVKSETDEKSDNNSGSSDDEDNDSPAANFGDESDHGSGTQSSWTKHAAEDQVDSPRMVSTPLEVPECPDSTCAQVINPDTKPSGSNMLSMTATKECQEQKEPPENAKLEKAVDTGLLKDSDQDPKFQVEVPTEMTSMNQYSAPKLDSSHYSEQIDKRTTELNETKESGVANKLSKIAQIIDTVFDDRKELPFIEQGVKRHRGVQDTGNAMQDDRNVLRRSESSAFTRYNAALHNKVSTGDAQSPTPPENSVDKWSELRHNIQSHSGSNAPNQCSNGGSVYVDMTSTSNNRLSEPITLKNKEYETLLIKKFHPSAFRSTKNNHMTSSQQARLEETHHADTVKMIGPPVSSIQELRFEPAHNIQQQQLPSNNENLLIKKMAEPIPHCGSSTVLGGHLEDNAGNCSVNASTSGSNYGSNGPNGCSSGANAGGMNMESDNGAGSKSGSADGTGSGSGSGGVTGTRSGGKMDQNKIEQREAVLTKFRQKRKERCFKRKVRYQSRKRLAEQRPRVRGQFVRQVPHENNSKDTDT